jgi:hypothetical protein
MVCLFLVCHFGWRDGVGGNAMRELVTTFAEPLNQVARSVDIVGQASFKRVWDHVVASMRNELEAASVGLMTRPVVDGQPGPQPTWSSDHQGSGTTIRTGECYLRQLLFASDQRRPLGAVSADNADAA